MEVDEACQILGADAHDDARALRAAHRRAIRRAHPDAGGSSQAAARVNEALAVLLDPPSRPFPPPDPRPEPPRAPVVTPPPPDVDRFFTVDAPPGELLRRLADAGHAVGEVVFVDPFVGMIEIVVGDPPAVGQLAVTVGATVDAGTTVSFTLEPLGITPAPPIGPVVDRLMAQLTG